MTDSEFREQQKEELEKLKKFILELKLMDIAPKEEVQKYQQKINKLIQNLKNNDSTS